MSAVKEVRKLAAVVAQLQQEQPDTDHNGKGQESQPATEETRHSPGNILVAVNPDSV